MEITELTLTLRMSLACQIVEPSHFLVTERGNPQFQAILGLLFDEASSIIIKQLIFSYLELLCS